jgi:hypothetical protein
MTDDGLWDEIYEIVKAENTELTYDGKRARSTDEEIMMAIAPIFSFYPNVKPTGEMLNVYKMLLRDIAPDVLAHAVLDAIKVCKFPPTVADIREHLPATRAPGPRSDVDPKTLKPVPTKMFRLDPEEDRRQRMNQLRRTAGWKYDA